MVGSQLCKECKHYVRTNGRQSIICNKSDAKVEQVGVLKWRKCKAGYKFPSDAIVIPQGVPQDTDPRLVKCAVWDSIYILVEDLKKLPIE